MRLFIGVNPTLNKQLLGDALRIVVSLDGIPLEFGGEQWEAASAYPWSLRLVDRSWVKWRSQASKQLPGAECRLSRPWYVTFARAWFRLHQMEQNTTTARMAALARVVCRCNAAKQKAAAAQPRRCSEMDGKPSILQMASTNSLTRAHGPSSCPRLLRVSSIPHRPVHPQLRNPGRIGTSSGCRRGGGEAVKRAAATKLPQSN